MEFSMSKFANKDHRYDALLYEIKTLRALVAELEHESAEYLCVSCNVIHPIQVRGKILQPCPYCGTAMEPTSFNLRQIKTLREQLAAAQLKIKTLREALLDTARRIEALKEPCGMDPETPTAIQNGRYASIALLIHDALNAARSKT